MNKKMKKVLDRQERYMINRYGDDLLLAYGTAHIVYDDYNLDDGPIEFCLRRTEEIIENPDSPNRPAFASEYDPKTFLEILKDTRKLLLELLEIPEEDRWIY